MGQRLRKIAYLPPRGQVVFFREQCEIAADRGQALELLSNDIRSPSGGTTKNPYTPCYCDGPA
jgi:hypothetical protein